MCLDSFLSARASMHEVAWYCAMNYVRSRDAQKQLARTPLKISLKSHEHRCCYHWKKLPWMILENSSQCRKILPKNTAARKIGNVVIPLLWQLRFHWNPHQNKSSSLYNTTVLTPGNFSKSLFIAVSLFSNVGDIDLESDYTEPQVGLFFARNVAN